MKHKHITKFFQCFKNFNEVQFLRDLANALEPFGNISPDSDVNEDFATWLSAIQSQLDRHAPLKSKELKLIISLNGTPIRNYEIGQHIWNTEIKQNLLYEVQKGNTFQNPLPTLRTPKLYGNICN